MEVADKIYKSEVDLMEFPQNLAMMLAQNEDKLSNMPVYQEIKNGEYEPLTWSQFITDISLIQDYLVSAGFKSGDHLAILSAKQAGNA
jgi:long-subunit acyl-CoA synthetase (AMP-forming)